MNTERFEVQVEEGQYFIEPQENGTYRIIQNEEKIGVIYVEPAEEGMQWRTLDELDDQLVFNLGEAISAYHKKQEENPG